MLTIQHSEILTDVIGDAKAMARDNRHTGYGAAHLLYAVMGKQSGLPAMLQAWEKDPDYFREWAEMRMENYPRADHPVDFLLGDESVDRVMEEAEKVRLRLGLDQVGPFCLLVALLTPGVAWSKPQLHTLPLNDQEAMQTISDRGTSAPAGSAQEGVSVEFGQSAPVSEQIPYCIRIGDAYSAEGRYTVGRDREVRRMHEALSRHHNTGVLIVGDAGVGKSALLQAFVHFREHSHGQDLSEARYYRLNAQRLLTGCAHNGEIESRFSKTLDKLRKLTAPILFIDDLHILLEDKGGGNNLAHTLSAALSEGGVGIIATTVTESFTKKIESQEALLRKLEVIRIQETDEVTTRKCLEVHRVTLEKHHELDISDEAMVDAANLARRYFKERKLPDSAIDLLDRTCTAAVQSNDRSKDECAALNQEMAQLKREIEQGMGEKVALEELRWLNAQIHDRLSPVLLGQMSNETNPDDISEPVAYLNYLESAFAELNKLVQSTTETITPVEVSALVAHHTGIPIGKIQAREKDKLLNLETYLKRRVVGQDQAVISLAEAIMESRSGLNAPGKPIGSFFFLGPTGTGKTELAKTLAEFLFNDENSMIRFDMSEFKEEHSAALLYGAPPGYVGYEEGGMLVNKIRQQPYSVVLFDEIEKAHPSVYDIFLQIMDEGQIHDRLGKKGSFVDAIVIFTSNIGSEWISDQFRKGHIPASTELTEIMAGKFRPEFLGRLTEVVPFGPITEEVAALIFDIQLKKLTALLRQRGIGIQISPAARLNLARSGYSDRYGARPIVSVIRDQIRRPISKMLVSAEIEAGMNLLLDLDANDKLCWHKNPPATTETTEV
jgi:ATP-dependent Clp protease ATP-binding subunit ClpA